MPYLSAAGAKYGPAKLQKSCHKAKSRCAKSLRALVCDYEDATRLKCQQSESDCDALALGSLIRALKSAGLSGPAIEAFEDTIDVLVHKLDNLQVTSSCNPTGYYDNLWGKKSNKKGLKAVMREGVCGCSGRLSTIRERLEADVAGMVLETNA